MRRLGLAGILFGLNAIGMADAVDDVRSGTDLDYDLVGMNYTYSGAASGSGSVLDADAPPGCIVKAPGSLNFSFSTTNTGLPFNITIPMTGTKLSSTKVKWTTDTTVNQCISIDVNGTPTQVLIRRVTGQMTANCATFDPFFDSICGQGYNTPMSDTASDAENYLNVEAYLLCLQSFFTRVNYQARQIDFVIYGGVPRGNVYGSEVLVTSGALFSGGIAQLASSDNAYVSAFPDEVSLDCTIEVDSNAPFFTLGQISVNTETGAARPGLQEAVSAYNQVSSAFEVVSGRAAPTVDSPLSVSLATPSNYINNTTRQVRVAVSWTPINDEDPAQDGWLLRMDAFKLVVAP